MQARVNLAKYDNSDYAIGAGKMKQVLWYYCSLWIFRAGWLPVFGLKRTLLRLFGAQIGKGVVIKPHVRIKYPWKLQIDEYAWIGEYAWIDNLAAVKIGANSVLSQESMLLTGSHNYKRSDFALITQPITLDEGCWIGARATVAPGVTCGSHAILNMQSTASHDLKPYTIYRGNPAQPVRERIIKAAESKRNQNGKQ